MYPSLRISSGNAYQPLIKFMGRRCWPANHDTPHPHPAAPPELREHFDEFLKKFRSSVPSGSKGSNSGEASKQMRVFEEFWEAPTRFWRPKVRDLEDAEVDAIMSGGASRY